MQYIYNRHFDSLTIMPCYIIDNLTYYTETPSRSPTPIKDESPLTPPWNQNASPIPIPLSAFSDTSESTFKWPANHFRESPPFFRSPRSPPRSKWQQWLKETTISPTLSYTLRRANTTGFFAPHRRAKQQPLIFRI